MNIQELTEKANGAIKEWSKNHDKLVVAIDGYTGVGKTTLLNNLVSINPHILPVNRDDFLISRNELREKLSKTEDRSVVWELSAIDEKRLINLVNAFKSNRGVSYEEVTYSPISGEIDIPKSYDLSKSIMVIEGVFMFHPKLTMSSLWDKRIYLEGDIVKIDERRIKREKEKWGDKYFPETHTDSHFKAVTTALKRYVEQYKPQEKANLVAEVD